MPHKLVSVRRAYNREYYGSRYESIYREKARKFKEKWRNLCFEAYGNKCNCCKETHKEFFQMDHINGGGRQDKLRSKKGSVHRKIALEGYPKDKYQLLCANCNWAKHFAGKCPHQLEDSK